MHSGGTARLTALLGFGLGVVAILPGCANDAPASGVARVDRTVVVAYKPCTADASVTLGRVEIRGSDDPDRVVWRARHIDGQPGTRDLPIISRYPGYRISGGRLESGQAYSVEAVATDGTAWGGPDFRLGELRQGQIRVAGTYVAFDEWVDEPASCPEVTWVGALLTGLVVAGVAGGALLVARGVRGAVRAARRAPSPDA